MSARTRVVCGRARGHRYGAVPPEVEGALERWLEERRVSEGVEVKPGRAYRFGEWMVKLYPPRTAPWDAAKDCFRASIAVRVAEKHARLVALGAPEPLVALELRRGLALHQSMFVCRFVEGEILHRAWGLELARAEFARFVARLHARGWFHGDLHGRNVLWDGRRFFLLDLDLLRRRFSIRSRLRLIADEWARVVHSLEPREGVRECFERYFAELRPGGDVELAWRRVLERANELYPRSASAERRA